ncbi:MAG TPA: serine/threonine-protein phosphatase [bacterium]|nr:serine/threonine-protein phosphatase [bacterium]
MKVPRGLQVGVCSHTGLVRGGNEDDFLLVTPSVDGSQPFAAAIADGMGGVAGGAEASRTALRALATVLLDAPAPDDAAAAERMRRGFLAANTRVYDAANAVPALRDMGTTLTALWLWGSRCVFGHIGDTRLYRLRGSACEVLTTDHVVREGENLLTRCIGGGQVECEPDGGAFEVFAGDRLVLVTDGVWNVVPDAEFADLAGARGAQSAAERLVRRALDAGGPDNATAVVVDVLALDGAGCEEQELPRRERPDARSLWPAPASLRPPIWPWLVLVCGALLLIWSALRWAGIRLFD